MPFDTQTIIYLLIAIVIAIVLFMFTKQKKGNDPYSINFDVDALLQAMGGSTNIKDVAATMSRITFYVHSQEIDVEKIKELGATGVVQTNDKVSIILGQVSQPIQEIIKKKISR